ncbi:DNA RNA-binding Alba [Olea europaea subsp. europaea]|uniref:DNA RNA-binding Alba n=1 Tax=Olea europaea subsp. europaea TaxID=158383 RepID=A0A8S0VIM9_OLEEU|nr:DNA RNA-binding Alba [Olea europaea subsp. europaea]
MEEITEGVNNIDIAGESNKRNRIQVSNTKRPLFFYVSLAKRYMQQHKEVGLSALGMAISTVVSIAEILKNNGFAVEKSKTFSFHVIIFCTIYYLENFFLNVTFYNAGKITAGLSTYA